MEGVPFGIRSRPSADRRGCARRPVFMLLGLSALGAGALLALDWHFAPLAAAQVVPAQTAEQAPAPALLPGAADASPLEQPLAGIEIEGNTSIPVDAIRRHIRVRPGRPATKRQIDDDIRALYGTKWFLHVEPHFRQTDEGPVLVFKVLERPIVRRVEFIGNEALSTEKLIAETGLKVGSPFDVSINRASGRRIEQLYKDKGYQKVQVELVTGGERTDREVVFRITEGPKIKVTWRTFEGNESFSSQLLKTKLQTKSAFIGLIGGNYDPDSIPNDIAALTQYYRNLGYFDVKITEEVTFHDVDILGWEPNREHAHVTYHIHEGTRYKVRRIDLMGANVISAETHRADLQMQAGEFFNARHVNHDAQAMQDRYGELGRLFAKVEPMPRFIDSEPGVVDLVYQIDEDKPWRIRRVDVSYGGDHPHTRRAVVWNQLGRVRPGELANPREIERSRLKIRGSGYFEPGSVHVEINPVDPTTLGGLQYARGNNPEAEGRRQSAGGSRQEAEDRRPQPVDRRQSAVGRPANQRFGNWQVAAAPPPERRPLAPRVDTDSPSEPTASAAPRGNGFGTGYRAAAGRPLMVSRDLIPEDSIIFRGQNFGDPTQQPDTPFFVPSPQGDPLEPGQRFAEPESYQEGMVDLEYLAEEGRTGRLMFGVGVNSDAGVVGSIVLSEQNFDITRVPTSFQDFVEGTAFRGAGQRFRVEAVPGSVVSRYLVSWTDPYFMDTDYSLGLSGFYYNRFFEDWDEERGGGRITVGRQWIPEISTSAALRLEQVNITDPDRPTPQILQEVVGDNFLSTAAFSIAYDDRDSAMLPSEGRRVVLTYEQGFGEFVYPRVELEGRQYFTVYSRPDGGGKHIVMAGGQAGWTGEDTPIFERFFAGGFQTFRGFDFRGVGPVQGSVRIGGEFMAIGTLEYMFPMLANEMVRGVVFTDFGTVENDVAFNDFRMSAGAGLRVTIPAMGPVPLAFDWAYPIIREDTDDRRLFSFYVGLTR